MLRHRYCWKAVMESIRKLEKVSGYQWWLLVDYWGTSNGVLDAWWTPKLAPDGMAQIRSINNEVIISPSWSLLLSDQL